jgi:DNA-binding PadR family transcriptional regulator
MYIHTMIKANTKRSPLALAVLVLLYESPMHGYGMQQQMQRRGEDEIVNVTQPNSLYQTIARLRRSGLIVASTVHRDKKRPERIVYELTEVGRSTISEWTRELLSKQSREFPEFPAAISFLPVLTPKDALRQLETRVEALKIELARLEGRLAAFQFLPRLFRLEMEYLHSQVDAERQWVLALADDLRAERLVWNKAWVRKAIRSLAQAHGADREQL